MWFGERLEITAPDISWYCFFHGQWKEELLGVSWGKGGDEYGNCSLYFSCALFSIVVFPGLCFQRKVELPEPGAHPFIDAMFWPDENPEEWKTVKPQ